ncbi:ASN_HP2_G0013540.mRNA.1.CDS.1 [Saccharomyces cerevisiae]|nr:ASN_HP2_G0013540.mRNA.1.CDS.1 [Saccharomyces cerevisiae]CAI6539153.1 ASN_HP2_G0013540.mRNA.1.CDS.1 [Saccharomyces cerevisiae]
MRWLSNTRFSKEIAKKSQMFALDEEICLCPQRIDDAKQRWEEFMQLLPFPWPKFPMQHGRTIGYQVQESVSTARFKVRQSRNVSGVYLPIRLSPTSTLKLMISD